MVELDWVWFSIVFLESDHLSPLRFLMPKTDNQKSAQHKTQVKTRGIYLDIFDSLYLLDWAKIFQLQEMKLRAR
mgnify:CR=1 FL=1